MKTQIRTLFLSVAIACFFTLTFAAFAQEKPAAAPAAQPAEKSAPPAAAASDDQSAAAPPAEPAEPALRHLEAEPSSPSSESVGTEKSAGDEKMSSDDSDPDAEQPKPVAPKSKSKKSHPVHGHHGGNESDRVSIFRNSHLGKGEKADTVVSVIGSSTSEGEVANAVVSIFGNTHVTGPVGDAVVTVLGSTYVNSKVNGECVTIMGDLELGPEAEIMGDVTIVGGEVKQDPKAVLHGQVNGLQTDSHFSDLTWLHAWFDHCVLSARPLAVGAHLGWLWALAFVFLGFYVFLALLFRNGIERCVQRLETRPGYAVIAAVLTMLLAPIVTILLAITGVGIVLVPFLAAGLFFAGLFGRAVMLAWLGRRFTQFFGDSPMNHPAMAVIVGAMIVLVLYLVPVLGLIVYLLLGMIGLGVVIYTLLLTMQREKPKPAMAAAAAAAPTPAPAPTAAAPVASFAVETASAPVVDAAATPVGTEAGAGAIPVPPVPPVPPVLPVAPTPVPPVMAISATLPRAGFWIRVAASFLDWMIIGAACGILHAGGSTPLLMAAYCVALWATKGTTVGGIVCGLKVVRLDGGPVDWSVALVRALGGFLSIAVAGLGFIWVAFDDDKQSWHDKIAGTTIVRVPKGVSLI